MYPQAKPFNCEIFPFYYEKGVFQVAAWCKYIEALDVRSFDSKVYNLIQEKVNFLFWKSRNFIGIF
jgi:hypothetical protein